MMLAEGQSLADLGVFPGACYRAAAVVRCMGLSLPWHQAAITWVVLTDEQQIELATQDGILLRLLCWDGASKRAHTHNAFIAQG